MVVGVVEIVAISRLFFRCRRRLRRARGTPQFVGGDGGVQRRSTPPRSLAGSSWCVGAMQEGVATSHARVSRLFFVTASAQAHADFNFGFPPNRGTRRMRACERPPEPRDAAAKMQRRGGICLMRPEAGTAATSTGERASSSAVGGGVAPASRPPRRDVGDPQYVRVRPGHTRRAASSMRSVLGVLRLRHVDATALLFTAVTLSLVWAEGGPNGYFAGVRAIGRARGREVRHQRRRLAHLHP